MWKSTIDCSGIKYGKLTALHQTEKGRYAKYMCRCDCGVEKVIHKSALVGGLTNSCGCWASEQLADRNTTHGMSKTAEYVIWAAIKRRCYLVTTKEYARYGARGIRVSDEWLNSFEAFFRDMGKRPEGLSIERIDNDGNYCKENCRWATPTEQANNRRSSRLINFNGTIKTLMQWSKETGFKQFTISQRIDKLGWSIEDALTKPLKPSWRKQPRQGQSS